MKVVISSGHGKHIRGAEGPEPWGLDEVDEARRVVDRVADFLRSVDVDVTTYHDDVSDDQNENLNRIVDFHNAQGKHDLDVSVHFNAYEETTTQPRGTECFAISQDQLADDVAAGISDASGLIDRGGKDGSNLFFCNNTAAPAILIEVAFVDSKPDCDLYRENFDEICRAIAEAIYGESIEDNGGDEIERPDRPERPEPPQWPDRPERVPVEDRPDLREGDEGNDVLDMQRMIPRFTGEFDGDFGPTTKENVIRYQQTRGLEATGVCDQAMWQALYDHKLPVQLPPQPGALTPKQQQDILRIANESEIADYDFPDRDVMPTGYTQGMALAFASLYLRLKDGHPAAAQMARANTGDEENDALAWYKDEFDDFDMPISEDGIDTLRSLFCLAHSLAPRESSGQHCIGLDTSAGYSSASETEAGLFQTSENASYFSDPQFSDLRVEYSEGVSPCYLDEFSVGVSCDSDDWKCWGDPDSKGYQHQKLCKECPMYAVETALLTLRSGRQHYGPVNRRELTVDSWPVADKMYRAIQRYMDESESAPRVA
jgi:peptidoglycan hydrolase-like protein with peptidoglycan-binding domain